MTPEREARLSEWARRFLTAPDGTGRRPLSARNPEAFVAKVDAAIVAAARRRRSKP